MLRKVIVYCDGLCEPINPGGIATYGYVIYIDDVRVHDDNGVYGYGEGATNNVAEYMAALMSLSWLKREGYTDDDVTLRSDSQLLIRQLNGIYMVRSPRIFPLYNHVKSVAEKFRSIKFEWVPREKNEEADGLSREAYYKFLRERSDLRAVYSKYLISEKQISFIERMCEELGLEVPMHLEFMSKREASKFIKELLSMREKHGK